jgi:hypothetical protein
MSTPKYRTLDVRAKAQQVVDHHYDDQKPGKPLYLLVPGGLIALASLALIIYIAYQTWYTGEMPAETNYTCPNCGAATPQDLLPPGTDPGDVSQSTSEK